MRLLASGTPCALRGKPPNKAIGMNLIDKTCSRIPEATGAMSSAQKPADVAAVGNIGGVYTGNLCDPGGVELPVIARIPDLDAPRQPHKHKRSSHSRTVKPASIAGRFLSAGLSLNILVGLGLVLLLGAIAPYAYNKIADGIQLKSDNTSQAWQTDQPAPVADHAPSWIPLAGQPKSSSQLSPNAPESNMPVSPPLSASKNAGLMEKDKTAAGSNINKNEAQNFIKRDNNIVQSNITSPLAGPGTNETSADIKSTPEKGSGTIAASQPSEGDRGPAVYGQSSAWPRIADDQANYSQWPNPAHPLAAAADSRNVAGMPAAADPLPVRNDSSSAVFNRSPITSGSPTGVVGSPPDLRPAEQPNYRTAAAANPRQNQPVTADRRNAVSPSTAAGTPLAPLSPPGTVQPGSDNEPAKAQFDGFINTHPDRNIYDRSRPSIH